ncbi:hypothetical protein D3C81_1733160 [compost metagenome]
MPGPPRCYLRRCAQQNVRCGRAGLCIRFRPDNLPDRARFKCGCPGFPRYQRHSMGGSDQLLHLSVTTGSIIRSTLNHPAPALALLCRLRHSSDTTVPIAWCLPDYSVVLPGIRMVLVSQLWTGWRFPSCIIDVAWGGNCRAGQLLVPAG